jgi:hypothetical protein
MKYRSEEIDVFMFKIEQSLSAISEKYSKALGVTEILKRDPLMSYDDAIRTGMRETANKALIQVIALSAGFDRVIAMVNQMAAHLELSGQEEVANLYRNRLKVLTNFDRIADEFDPSKSNEFAHVEKGARP